MVASSSAASSSCHRLRPLPTLAGAAPSSNDAASPASAAAGAEAGALAMGTSSVQPAEQTSGRVSNRMQQVHAWQSEGMQGKLSHACSHALKSGDFDGCSGTRGL